MRTAPFFLKESGLAPIPHHNKPPLVMLLGIMGTQAKCVAVSSILSVCEKCETVKFRRYKALDGRSGKQLSSPRPNYKTVGDMK